ncbi:MAG: transcriptional regulator, partial [Leifsonia flava]
DVVVALGRWGFQAMGTPEPGDIVTEDSMTIAFRTAFRADAAGSVPATTYVAHIGDASLSLHVSDGQLVVLPRAHDDATPDLEFSAGPDIRLLIAGEVSPADAVANGTVQILEGNPALLDRFAATFSLAPQAVPF